MVSVRDSRNCNAARIVVVLFVGMLLIPQYVPAQEARLSNFIITNTRDDLLLYLNVEGAFPNETKEAILSGVPTTFTFYISLYRVRDFWYDEKIIDLEITHDIKYDSLKNEFTINRSWENGKTRVVASFEEAQKLMTDIDSLTIAPLSQLEKGKQYQIRAKAQLNEMTLPLYLHYVLFFVSLWDFETDWYTIDFLY
jgi:hypothetical protein